MEITIEEYKNWVNGRRILDTASVHRLTNPEHRKFKAGQGFCMGERYYCRMSPDGETVHFFAKDDK